MSRLVMTDLVLGVSSFLVAALLWGLVRAVARGQVGRNGALGLRTPATMASDQAWQSGHRAARPIAALVWLLVTGCDAAGVVTALVYSSHTAEYLFMVATGLVIIGSIASGIRADTAARHAQSG